MCASFLPRFVYFCHFAIASLCKLTSHFPIVLLPRSILCAIRSHYQECSRRLHSPFYISAFRWYFLPFIGLCCNAPSRETNQTWTSFHWQLIELQRRRNFYWNIANNCSAFSRALLARVFFIQFVSLCKWIRFPVGFLARFSAQLDLIIYSYRNKTFRETCKELFKQNSNVAPSLGE